MFTRVEDIRKLCVELALECHRQTVWRVRKEDARLFKTTRYVQKEGPDLMSDIEGFHPLLGQ